MQRNLALGLVLFIACSEPAADERQHRVANTTTHASDVTATEGGSAASADGLFKVVFRPADLAADVRVTIRRESLSPAPSISLTHAYSVSLEPATALAITATPEVVFTLAEATYDAAGGVRIAHGESVATGLDGLLAAVYDSELQELTATTSSFSFFVAINYAEYLSCSCDQTDACDLGCDFCDGDCETNTTPDEEFCTLWDSALEHCPVLQEAGSCPGLPAECNESDAQAFKQVAACWADSDCSSGQLVGCADVEFSEECRSLGEQGGGNEEPATPEGWLCNAFFYGQGDGCDCGCGIEDPDCGEDLNCAEPGCDASQTQCEFCYNDATGCSAE